MQQSQIRNRRLVAARSVVGGCLFYLFNAHIIGRVPAEMKGRYSIFWGDISSWPSFVRDFWPLDLAACCGFVWLLVYLAVIKFDPYANIGSVVRSMVSLTVGVGISFGSVGGAFIAGDEGWYFALEGFVLFSVAVICLIIAFIFLGTVAYALSSAVVRGGRRVWQCVRGWRVFRPFIIAGNWLSARDTPGEAPEDPSRR